MKRCLIKSTRRRQSGYECVCTEPRFRRVLMLCFPLSPSSSSLTGLNINGGGSTGFSMGGSSPYFLKWMRQSVHSKMFSRPPWCQSLEAEGKGGEGGRDSQRGNDARTSSEVWRHVELAPEPAIAVDKIIKFTG